MEVGYQGRHPASEPVYRLDDGAADVLKFPGFLRPVEQLGVGADRGERIANIVRNDWAQGPKRGLTFVVDQGMAAGFKLVGHLIDSAGQLPDFLNADFRQMTFQVAATHVTGAGHDRLHGAHETERQTAP